MSNENKESIQNNPPHTSDSSAKTVLILAVLLAFLVGTICGYFFGENRAYTSVSSNYIGSGQNNNNNQSSQPSSSSPESQAPTVDYSKYIINETDGITIDNYYGDDVESKEFASKLIGTSLPTFKWIDADGVEQTTDDIKGKYIFELFSPTCVHCQQSAPEIAKFKEAYPEVNFLSLTTQEGDISEFGSNAYLTTNVSDATVGNFLNNVPYVPAFLLIDEGKIKLLTFGGVTKESLEDFTTVAFASEANPFLKK